MPICRPSNDFAIPHFHRTVYDWEPLCWGASEGGESKRVGMAIFEEVLQEFTKELDDLNVTLMCDVTLFSLVYNSTAWHYVLEDS
jgi:hypothetical protein